MKLTLITLSFICISNFHSQVTIDVEAPRAISTDCFFNNDGSFYIKYLTGAALKPAFIHYDKNGQLIPDEKLPFYKLNNLVSKSFFDESSNIYYTLEPENPIHFGVKPKEINNLNQIWSHSSEKSKDEPEIIKFNSSLNTTKMKKSSMFSFVNKEINFKNKAGNIVWFEVICGTNELNPKNNKVKNEMYSFLKRTELNLADNSVSTKMCLVNKSIDIINLNPPDNYGYQIMNILGEMNNKIYVCYSPFKIINGSKKNDIWSYNEETGEEKLEYSYTYLLGEKDNYDRDVLMPKSFDKKASLFFYSTYTSFLDRKDYQRAIHYKIIEINNDGQVIFHELDIPDELVTSYTQSPDLGCYQDGKDNNFHFEVASSNRKTTDLINFKQNNEGDYEANLIPGLDNFSADLLFDPFFKGEYSEYVKTIYPNIDELCNNCEEVVKSKIYKSSTKYCVLTLNYTKYSNNSLVLKKNIKARLFTIPITQ